MLQDGIYLFLGGGVVVLYVDITKTRKDAGETASLFEPFMYFSVSGTIQMESSLLQTFVVGIQATQSSKNHFSKVDIKKWQYQQYVQRLHYCYNLIIQCIDTSVLGISIPQNPPPPHGES